jgi:phosphate transport system permease protein
MTAEGELLLIPVRWLTTFGESRTVVFQAKPAIVLATKPFGKATLFSLRGSSGGGADAVAAFEDGKLRRLTMTVEVDDFTEEVTTESKQSELGSAEGIAFIRLSNDGRTLFAGRDDGAVGYMDLANSTPGFHWESHTSPARVATFLKGEISLITGHENGDLLQWQVVTDATGKRLTKMRQFDGEGSPVTLLAPSQRHKGFMALDAAGRLGLYHPTSERLLWNGRPDLAAARCLYLAPRDDAAILLSADALLALDVHNPHPEAGFKAFFGKVWYESYPEPAHVWQSSAGNDDYEPKLGMVPLIFGTLKGTLFSLIFAVPISVLAALYASQFMHPTLRGRVKPAIEIMAAVPSVVLGFVAGLWLAQVMDKVLPGLILVPILLPLSILLGGWLWHRMPKKFRSRFRPGTEVAFFALFALGGFLMCTTLSPVVESVVFGGNFQKWLRDWMGLAYDQQNAIVVSIAMGFAVIPIIFTIAEEAFSAVPRSLPLGSLALGATPWQTVVRVVVPSASPGVFSAVMVGFGRAVGETMIVLMAAGNTPILDWNPFLGFRTLSANIATEIPEAPVGGTLYRTLFLAALLLFILTFAVNTVAEVVRGRLRKRYGNF